MGFKNAMKKGLFSGVKPKEWLGFGEIKNGTGTIKSLLKKDPKRKQQQWHSFEEFMYANNLTESDVKRLSRLHYWISLGCAVGFIIIFSYAIHLFSNSLIIGGFIAVMLSLYLLAYAYSENIQAFKLKKRILTTTFTTWLHSFFSKET